MATVSAPLSARQVGEAFRMRGLAVQAEAVAAILRQLKNERDPAGSFRLLAKELVTYLERRRAAGPSGGPAGGGGSGGGGGGGGADVVDAEAVVAVVAEITRNDDEFKRESVSVVSAFNTPRYGYDVSSNTYFYRGRGCFPLHAGAAAKLAIYEERLALVHARLMRQPAFQAPLPGIKRPHLQLSRVDDLAAMSERSRSVNMLGLLTQPEDGLFCLEDSSGMAVALDLTSHFEFCPGLVTETCVVLVAGTYFPDEFPPGFGPAGAAEAAAANVGVDAMAVDAEADAAVAPRGSSGGSSSSSSSNNDGRIYRGVGGRGQHRASGAGAGPSAGAPGPGAPGLGAAETEGRGADTKFTPLTDGRLPGVLRVTTLGLPPPEDRATTLRAMALVDPLRALQTPAEFERVRRVMETSEDVQSARFAVLSDVHLDRPEVLVALRTVLQGLGAGGGGGVPTMFVLLGAFCSRPFGQHPGDRALYRAGFDALAALLADFPEVAAATHFVFVPGPTDPGADSEHSVLPRPPLPASIVAALVNNPALPLVTFATNPCRVRFFTREIVFFRQDLSLRLRRRALLTPLRAPPGGTRALLGTEHMHATVLRQAHLCPLPLQAQPIYWEHDHALRLTPMPDVVVIAEDEEQYEYSDDATGARFLNPGSFAAALDFAVLYPAQLRSEASNLREAEVAHEDHQV